MALLNIRDAHFLYKTSPFQIYVHIVLWRRIHIYHIRLSPPLFRLALCAGKKRATLRTNCSINYLKIVTLHAGAPAHRMRV